MSEKEQNGIDLNSQIKDPTVSPKIKVTVTKKKRAPQLSSIVNKDIAQSRAVMDAIVDDLHSRLLANTGLDKLKPPFAILIEDGNKGVPGVCVGKYYTPRKTFLYRCVTTQPSTPSKGSRMQSTDLEHFQFRVIGGFEFADGDFKEKLDAIVKMEAALNKPPEDTPYR